MLMQQLPWMQDGFLPPHVQWALQDIWSQGTAAAQHNEAAHAAYWQGQTGASGCW